MAVSGPGRVKVGRLAKAKGRIVTEADTFWIAEDGRVFDRLPGRPRVVNAEQAKSTSKPGRNDLCACGSGKKVKRCCGVQG